METKEYFLEVKLRICEKERGYEGLELANTYRVQAPNLLALLRILAELEEFTRTLAEEVSK